MSGQPCRLCFFRANTGAVLEWRRARMLLEVMNASTKLETLKIKGPPPDIRLHKLSGDRKGQWSITIHKTSGWKIAFGFENGEFYDVEIVDYHGE